MPSGRSALLAAGLAAASLGWAGDAPSPVVREAAEIDWKASGSLPPGAEYHLVYEDSGTHGIVSLVRMPRGYALPAHSHTHDEVVVVQKGRLVLTFDGKARALNPGGYALIPGGTVFTLKAEGFGGAQFLASFNGPYDAKPAAAAKP